MGPQLRSKVKTLQLGQAAFKLKRTDFRFDDIIAQADAVGRVALRPRLGVREGRGNLI